MDADEAHFMHLRFDSIRCKKKKKHLKLVTHLNAEISRREQRNLVKKKKELVACNREHIF